MPRFGPDDNAIEAYLAMEAVAIGATGVIELGRECLKKQREDYAGNGGH